MKKIVIVGGGFANKGAEALIISTISVLSSEISGARFIIVAVYKNDDLEKLRDYNVELISYPGITSRFLLIISALIYKLFPFNFVKDIILNADKNFTLYSESDLFVDISGFALTDQFGFLAKFYYCSNLLMGKLFDIPYIIFPQSMGPFDRLSTKLMAKTFLPMAKLIMARGDVTKKFLENININKNIYVIPDVAFLFEPASNSEALKIMHRCNIKKGENGLICIVPNMEIYKRSKGNGKTNDYILLLSEICNFISENFDATILLLHHNYEADTVVINLIKDSVNSTENIYTIDRDYNSAELKALIGQTDFVIASRYHSAVGALSMRIPLIILGWSQKYEELMAMIGLEDCVMDYNDISYARLEEKLKLNWSNRFEMKLLLNEKVPDLVKSAKYASFLAKEALYDQLDK